MPIKAEDQQKAVLTTLVKKLGDTAYGKSLGLEPPAKGADLTAMHAAFAAKVPLVQRQALLEKAAVLCGLPPKPEIPVWSHNGLLLTEPPAAFAYDDDKGQSLFPLSGQTLKAFGALERNMPATYRKQWPALGKGTWFYLCEDAITAYQDKFPVGDLMALQMEQKGGLLTGGRDIAPDLADIAAVGRSRAQALLAYADALAKAGKGVHTVVASAKTLTDMCFLLAQREARFVPLQQLCPAVQLVVLTDDSRVYRRELQYFLAGLEVAMTGMMARPYGLLAWQPDLNAEAVLTLPVDDGLFYEFIPVTDVDAQGRPKADAKRLHASQTTPGRDYVLVVSTLHGLAGYMTDDVVHMMDREPMTFKYQRKVRQLNGFGEHLTEDVVNTLMAAFNEALVPYGFFIRDYMVGDRAGDRCPHWVLEISRLPADVPEKVLQSVTNRLHREISAEIPAYLAAFRNNRTFPPSIHFVPMGTFAHMPYPFTFQHFDFTPEAEVIDQVLARAGANSVHLRGPLL